MKLRVIAAAALLPVLLVIVLVAPAILTAIVLGILCAIAAYELLNGTGLIKNVRLTAYATVMAFFVPIWCYYGMEHLWALLAVMIYFVLLFVEVLISHGKVRLERLSICIIGGILIPYLLSALVRIMSMELNRFLILIPFILAFLSDSGAYFIGCSFGRHKLAPIISPNKSIEGLVGGVVCAIIGMLLYCWILDFAFQMQVSYAFAVTYGVIGSIAGAFGDLCFSAIKRQCGIKDYGNLIPGHGGVLDRFDSVIVVAPLVEILCVLLPVVG